VDGAAPGAAVLVTTVKNGTLSLAADGSFEYTPAANFAGTDSFTYKAEDAGGLQSAVANVTITVGAVNDPPTAASFAYTVTAGETLAVNAPGLLAGATDPDNVGGLQVVTTPVTAPANGVLALAANGSFTYTATADFSGAVSFIFKIKDARNTLESAPATVDISVGAPRCCIDLLFVDCAAC
jgi:VCBS repeat-containing protein